MAGSNISVVFQAFTDKFEAKTKKAGKSVGNFAKKAIGIGASFLIARAGVAKFTQSFAELAKLGELSKSLQVSPDFLRGLKIGAEEVGESFEKAQDLIKEFNIRIGEAAGVGTGPAVEALELIGLAVKDLEGLNPEEQFLKVAEALSKIDNQQVKIFAAGDIFGGAGEDMLALLDQGEAGIKSFIEKARELGGPISREDLDQIARANVAIKDIGTAFDGIIERLLIEFAPVLEDMAFIMQDLVGYVKDFGDAWKGVQNTLTDVFSIILHGGEGLGIELGGRPGRGDSKTRNTGKFSEIGDGGATSVKAFANAAQAGSSAAFDQLNPNRPSSVAGKQLGQLEQINTGIKKLNEKESTEINFKQVNIPG